MVDLLVSPCDTKASRFAVTHWHYSKTLPVGKCVQHGVWENNRFVGVVIYAWGANHNLAKPFGLDMVECVELVRVAMDQHQSPVSQVVSRSLAMLKEKNPGLRLVVSFADPYQNHHGGIYQAGNWVYTGATAPKKDFVMPDGHVLNRRAYTGQQFGQGSASRAQLPKEARPIIVPGKHRYVYPLDRGMRRKVNRLALPYPARDSGFKSETSPVQGEGPGAIPGNRSERHSATGKPAPTH